MDGALKNNNKIKGLEASPKSPELKAQASPSTSGSLLKLDSGPPPQTFGIRI